MARASHNWSHWHAVWMEIAKTGVSLAQFCKRENLPYDPCRIAFKKLEKNGYETETSTRKCNDTQWAIWKQEFLAGDFKTISEFVRTKGLKPGTGFVSRNTRGWLVERGKIRAQSEAESVAAIADSKGAEAIASLHGRALIALYQVLGDVEANGPVRNKIHQSIDGPRDNADFLRGVNLALDALLKVLPPIARIEAATATRTILQKVLDQGLDVTDASIRLEMMGVSLPETLKILLAKQEPTQPETPENEIPSDEELEKRWRDGIDKIKNQEETFIPERQREIEELKTECKDADSFADNTF
jgi:hypothetical protein